MKDLQLAPVVKCIATAHAGRGVDILEIGSTRIFRVPDIDSIAWPAQALFATITNDALLRASQSAPSGTIDADTGRILLSFNSYLIETPEFVALIDAGIGNDKGRPDRPAWHMRTGGFLDLLAKLGFPPERIDLVVNTHLHADHVGWNTMRINQGWKPTFPRARYVTSATELAYWQARHDSDPSGNTLHGAFADSIQPLIALGRLEGLTAPCYIAAGLRLEPAPGHSPGMMTVRLTTAASDVLFLADAIHHPLQFSEPGLCTNFCTDPAQAQATRSSIFAACTSNRTILAPYHFPSPAFGRIEEDDARFTFIPLDHQLVSPANVNRIGNR